MRDGTLLTKADIEEFKRRFLKWYIALATINALGTAALIQFFG